AASITEEKLNPTIDSSDVFQGLRSPWSERWPELADVPWVPAVGDGAASNVGSGCVDPMRVAINLGTSGAIRIVVPADRIDVPPELWCYRVDGDRFVLGQAFSDGGNDLAWALQTLALPDAETIAKEIAARPADC